MFLRFSPFLICALVLIFSGSCKKGKATITLQGVVINETAQSGMSDQTVELYQVMAGTTVETLIGTATTDALGGYSFTFARDKAEKYIIRVAPENYFPIAEIVNFSDLSIEETNFRNVSTTAKAWVKLVFTNLPPSNSWDNLRFTLDEGKTDCEECLLASTYELHGAVDTIIYTANDGNTLFRYYYELASTPLNGYKSATTVAFDTTTLILEY